MDFLRQHQLNIMLFLSGICSVLAILSMLTNTMPPKRRRTLVLLEVCAALLLIMDRYAYIYRGNVSTTGWWMGRISNFCVFLFSILIILLFNAYLKDLFLNEGNLEKTPKRLLVVDVLICADVVILILSQFFGWLYTFNQTNRYMRAPLFPVAYIVPGVSMLLQFSVIINFRKKIRPIIRIPLILFDIVPIVATLIQFFLYGISLQNIAMTGEAIFLYMFVLIDMNDTVEKMNRLKIEFLEDEQKDMQVLFEQTALALANAIDANNAHTHGHSSRVAEYSKQIAVLAGKTEKECEEIYFAGLLHDIGKIGIPNSIINKDGKLNEEELNEFKKHPIIGNKILSSIQNAHYLSIAAHYHHERYDGHGYPEGLKGNDIPDVARIVAVADAYDGMTSKRSYHEPLPQQMAREEIVKGIETQFDPDYAKFMIHMIDLDTEYTMREHSDVKALAGKNSLDCKEYRGRKSEGILIAENIVKIHLHSTADEKFLSEKTIPSFIIFDSLDARIYDDEKKQKELLYLEYACVRMDGKFVQGEVRKIQAETKKLKEYTGEELLSAYKNGVDYYIEAVRVKDHLMLMIQNDFMSIQVIVALPYIARFSYLGLTGENCRISEVTVETTDEKASENYIPRIAEEIDYTKGLPVGGIPNVQIDGWRSKSSDPVPVSDGMKITFHSQSMPTARLIWHCPYILLYYSDDAKINGPNFKEYIVLRIDGENWESNSHATNKVLISRTPSFESWDAWKAMNKSGIDCEVLVNVKGSKITLTTENAGIALKSVTELNEDAGQVYLSLTGDQCTLSNIRIE